MAAPHGSSQYPSKPSKRPTHAEYAGSVGAGGGLLQHAQHHDPTGMQTDRHRDIAGERARQAQDQPHHQPRQERVEHQRRMAQGRERQRQQVETAAPA